MSNLAVKCEGLSKMYRLGTHTDIGKNRSKLKFMGVPLPLQRLWPVILNQDLVHEGENTMWALKDIDLEVERGDILGIVGRNGSGKSTLLKVLARITEPTHGRAMVTGRLGSLLEVGTGFHPELTGRQNVYLNGSILGMSSEQITRKLDEIVDFAEVEKFLDTPVKHYSSGMQTRLAFSVAAHLECEILLVDEVLSVGDIHFQRKCLGKIDEQVHSGKTVLFVSHNHSTVMQVCNKAILMENGEVTMQGKPQTIVEAYLAKGLETIAEAAWPSDLPASDTRVSDDETFRLRSVRLLNSDEQVLATFDVKEDIVVEIEYEVSKEKHNICIHFYLYHESGICLFCAMDHKYTPYLKKPNPVGLHKARCTLPRNLLSEGIYNIEPVIVTHPTSRMVAYLKPAVVFQMTDDMSDEGGVRYRYEREWPSTAMRPELKWSDFN